MSSLLAGLLGALVASNQPVAVSNYVAATTGLSVTVPNPNHPAKLALDKVMKDDDAAQAEVDGWIKENNRFKAKGAGVPRAELNQRIRKRFEPVRREYEDLIKQYPDYADARVAFASFLNDTGDPGSGVLQLEKAKKLNPKDPAIWNNLGNYYGEFGPVTNAFACYTEAIRLNPKEPVYYENFATCVSMFRKDARKYYHINERQVFEKALALYGQALKQDPDNFPLATDLALTYYLMHPIPIDEALASWTNALHIAHNEVEREGVYIHMARLEGSAGRFPQAYAHLNAVTNPVYANLKRLCTHGVQMKEADARKTNAPPAAVKEKSKTPAP